MEVITAITFFFKRGDYTDSLTAAQHTIRKGQYLLTRRLAVCAPPWLGMVQCVPTPLRTFVFAASNARTQPHARTCVAACHKLHNVLYIAHSLTHKLFLRSDRIR